MDTNRWLYVAMFLVVSVGLVLLSGWRQREDLLRARHEALTVCQEKRAAAHPEWTAEQCRLICMNRVWNGMTPEQGRASWGNPSSVQKSVTETGESETWEYGGLGWLLFEDGLLADYEE